MTQAKFKSCLYTGTVSHTRLAPKYHKFSYRLFMMYLDLSELEVIFKKSWLWSLNKRNFASFMRSDYLGDNELPLSTSIRRLVESKTGTRPEGAIRLLTNIRYFGFIINPISCYYCFDKEENLQFVVAEVTNTPWQEQTAYIIPCSQDKGCAASDFDKKMHVSPFMPMNINYAWRSNDPQDRLRIFMENRQDGKVVFNASLGLKRKEISTISLNLILLQYPIMTLKVAFAIYWQALKLLLKKTPFFISPNKSRKKRLEGVER